MKKTSDLTPRVSLLLIGDELTTGAVNDTNGKYLAEKLTELGLTVIGLELVRDRMEEIIGGISRAASRSELVILTGGLGPTSDDITRDAVAGFLGVELVENKNSLVKILYRYAERGIPMNEISRRQALFPKGATVVNNSPGTADSFWIENPNLDGFIFSFPGVPREMRTIFDEELMPLICSRFNNLKTPEAAYLKFFGLSESAIGDAIEQAKIGSQFVVGYRPVYPEVWVKITSPSASSNELKLAAEAALKSVGEAHLIANSYERTLPKVVLEKLKKVGKSLAFAESCTGGLSSSLMVSEAGSSSVFMGSIVCYSNEAKIIQVGVTPETIEKFGAVSAETALELAKGVREKLNSSIGISITGIAGPDGGTSEKPVGTVFLGYSTEDKTEVVRYLIPIDRNRFRSYCAHLALDLVRRDLNGFPLQFERR